MFAAGLRKIFLPQESHCPLSHGRRRRRLLPTCPAMRHLVAGLGVRGKLIVIGVPDDPIQLSSSHSSLEAVRSTDHWPGRRSITRILSPLVFWRKSDRYSRHTLSNWLP